MRQLAFLTNTNIKSQTRVPWWLSRLGIQHCHCCGAGSIPGLGTSSCHGHGQNKKQKKPKQRVFHKGIDFAGYPQSVPLTTHQKSDAKALISDHHAGWPLERRQFCLHKGTTAVKSHSGSKICTQLRKGMSESKWHWEWLKETLVSVSISQKTYDAWRYQCGD